MISRNDGGRTRLYDLCKDPDRTKNITWRNSGVARRKKSTC
jgi:hypothetical protein